MGFVCLVLCCVGAGQGWRGPGTSYMDRRTIGESAERTAQSGRCYCRYSFIGPRIKELSKSLAWKAGVLENSVGSHKRVHTYIGVADVASSCVLRAILPLHSATDILMRTGKLETQRNICNTSSQLTSHLNLHKPHRQSCTIRSRTHAQLQAAVSCTSRRRVRKPHRHAKHPILPSPIDVTHSASRGT